MILAGPNTGPARQKETGGMTLSKMNFICCPKCGGRFPYHEEILLNQVSLRCPFCTERFWPEKAASALKSRCEKTEPHDSIPLLPKGGEK